MGQINEERTTCADCGKSFASVGSPVCEPCCHRRMAVKANNAVPDKEWLEYQFFVALHNLKEVAPDHYLVTTVEMALQARPAFMKRQAD